MTRCRQGNVVLVRRAVQCTMEHELNFYVLFKYQKQAIKFCLVNRQLSDFYKSYDCREALKLGFM